VIAIRVGDEVFELEDDHAEELLRRVRDTELPDVESEVAESLDRKLAAAGDEPAAPDAGELALLGIVIEAWATELGTDAADVERLRDAIAEELG
jgi:hypothetical protein